MARNRGNLSIHHLNNKEYPMAPITMTVGFKWWLKPLIYAVFLIAYTTRMDQARALTMIEPFMRRAIWSRIEDQRL